MVIVGPWGCESHLRTETPLRLQKLGWEKHVMFIVAKLKHSDNCCIAFCEGRCEVFWSWLVPKVEADQFSGLGTGAIPQVPHLVIAQDVLLWLVQVLHILLLAIEALFLCPDSAGVMHNVTVVLCPEGTTDYWFINTEVFLLISEHFLVFRAIFQRRCCRNFGRI